jgi:hypothetical protein
MLAALILLVTTISPAWRLSARATCSVVVPMLMITEE